MTRYGEVCSFPSRGAPPMEAPYFHNGSKARFDDVVEFYINSSQLAPGLATQCSSRVPEYVAQRGRCGGAGGLLKSLTEDYDDA